MKTKKLGILILSASILFSAGAALASNKAKAVKAESETILVLRDATPSKDEEYNQLSEEFEELSDIYVELENTKIDSIETYDKLNEDLWNLFSDFGDLLSKAGALSEKYGDKKFIDLENDIVIAYAEVMNSILNKHDEVMNLVSKEVNAIIDSINGKADLIYELLNENKADVRKLLEEAIDLSLELDRLVNTLGEYREIFGVESVLDDLELKEELEYAKVEALIENIRGAQKEGAIESIVSRCEYLTETTNYFVDNNASESDCDALIEAVNSLITEIDDNYQILGGDERLNQTKAKLNENLNKLNELKDSAKSANTRNIILIVVGSILGAAIFFFGGFFISKLIKREKKEI